MRLNREKFARYISNFGFGIQTGVDLPREENGLVPDWHKWPQVTHATISMGQGIGVTPLQILKAICSVANGGTLVQPHLLHDSSNPQIERVQYQPDSAPRQVLRPQITDQLKGMMKDVLTDGTGKSAQLEGYSAAGKTGTAQKTERGGGYSHTRFIASFVGFAPLEHPVIAAVVTLDEPRGLYYGGEVAAPVFRAIAQKVLQYLAVAPDQPLTPEQLAQLRRRQMEQAVNEVSPTLDAAEMKPEFSLASYTTPPAVPVGEMENDLEKTGAQPENSLFPGVEVPDFSGRSMRGVLAEMSRLGMQLNALGSGTAILQLPAPHSRVTKGAKVTVQFSRRAN
jgi:stage V sporulation protein D (sporulation-specific penicillin-binding protein)